MARLSADAAEFSGNCPPGDRIVERPPRWRRHPGHAVNAGTALAVSIERSAANPARCHFGKDDLLQSRIPASDERTSRGFRRPRPHHGGAADGMVEG